MTSQNDSNHGNAKEGKTIDLRGVAAFASLVELLTTELGTSGANIQGLLPNGPQNFDELVGEIRINTQGFQRSLILRTKPGSNLRLTFNCSWGDGQNSDGQNTATNGIEARYFLDTSVDQILPQGRALARYIEDIFGTLDSMVTLGQSNKLATMAVSASDIEAFEHNQADNLVRNFSPKRTSAFDKV